MGTLSQYPKRQARGLKSIIFALALVLSGAAPAFAQPIESFDAFKTRFEAVAVSHGVGRDFYRAVMGPVRQDESIARLIFGQPEFATPIWDYLDQRVTASRISRGQQAYRQNRALFEQIGAAYGVDPYLLAAIWGVETDYGAALSNSAMIKPVIASLASLAHQRRGRVAEDEAELLAALTILQRSGIASDQLVGSWAGALGHLQLIPTAYLQYGRDGDGNGTIDVHGSLADALASSAAYLRGLGYQPGLDWGFEVEVPDGFDYLLADREQMRPIRFFAERGVTRVAGRQFGNSDTEVFLYVPAGKDGPKFLATANFLAIKGYNFSDSYVLSVGHLTDRLKGSGPFVASWPRQTRFPNRAERIEIQTLLTQLGHYGGAIDGMVGPITQSAYARFQAQAGEVADGFITANSLTLLRTQGGQ